MYEIHMKKKGNGVNVNVFQTFVKYTMILNNIGS